MFHLIGFGDFEVDKKMEVEPEGGRHYEELGRQHYEKKGNGKDDNLMLEQHHEIEEEEGNGEEDFWGLLDFKNSIGTRTDILNSSVIPFLKLVSVMVLLYFFICSLDLTFSAMYPVVRRVLWDHELLDSHTCGLLYVIFSRAGVLLQAGLQIIQQAVLVGASIGAYTTAIVLVVQVCAQRRKYHMRKFVQKCVLIWLYFSSVCQGASGAVIPVNTSFEFNCSVQDCHASVWQIRRKDGFFEQIAQSGNLFNRYSTNYSLTECDRSGNNETYNFQTLTLFRGTEYDEGLYLCEEDVKIRTEENLTVEVPPHVHLEVGGLSASSTIDFLFKEEVTLKCIAKGGKPEVELSWSVNGEVKKGISDRRGSSEGTISSTLQYLPAIGDAYVTCTASGQQVIPKQQISVEVNVQYLNCSLGIVKIQRDHVLNCTCDANPDVKTKEIYVNGSSHSEKTVKLPCDEPADVFCKASNGAVTSTTEEEFLRPFCFGSNKEKDAQVDLIIVIIIAVILASIVAAVSTRTVYKKCKNKAEKRKNKINLLLRAQWKRKQDHKTKGPDSEGTEPENV